MVTFPLTDGPSIRSVLELSCSVFTFTFWLFAPAAAVTAAFAPTTTPVGGVCSVHAPAARLARRKRGALLRCGCMGPPRCGRSDRPCHAQNTALTRHLEGTGNWEL